MMFSSSNINNPVPVKTSVADLDESIASGFFDIEDPFEAGRRQKASDKNRAGDDLVSA